jgi:hypothetical protein
VIMAAAATILESALGRAEYGSPWIREGKKRNLITAFVVLVMLLTTVIVQRYIC